LKDLVITDFTFKGLKNNKAANQNIAMFYPGNENVIPVLKLMAEKTQAADRLDDYLCCHYKLFQDDMNTVNYGFGADIVADKMHTREERDFVYEMDAILRGMGYYSQPKGGNEGPGYAYYDKESVMKTNGPYLYRMQSWKTVLILSLRIRNAAKCLEYLEHCPDTVKQYSWEGTAVARIGLTGYANSDRSIRSTALHIGDAAAATLGLILDR